MEHHAADDFEWAERSEYWLAYETKGRRGTKSKFKYRQPLILCGHGVRLRVNHGTLLIRNGFTHYPQKSEEIRLFRGDANLPDRIIILDGSGGISFDALDWISEQRIAFIRLDWRGCTQVVGGNSAYSARGQLVEAQKATKTGWRRTEFAKWLIREKLTACMLALKGALPKSAGQTAAILGLRDFVREIDRKNVPVNMPRIFGIEGRAAACYFRAWRGIPLRWSGLNRKPIPENWKQIGARGMNWRDGARNARHPINAMLNYGYGMLASQVRIQAVAAGLDPSIGIMHGNKNNRIPLVYDLMEPLRPVVDRDILQFAKAHTFAPGDFTINQWGGCRLNPQMAKVVAAQVSGLKADRVVTDFLKFLR